MNGDVKRKAVELQKLKKDLYVRFLKKLKSLLHNEGGENRVRRDKDTVEKRRDSK